MQDDHLIIRQKDSNGSLEFRESEDGTMVEIIVNETATYRIGWRHLMQLLWSVDKAIEDYGDAHPGVL